VVNGQVTLVQDRTAELNAGLAQNFSGVASFGEDASGEVYFTTMAYTGQLFRIDPLVPSCTAPVAYCATSPNSVGGGAAMSSTGSASVSTPELVLVSESAPTHTLEAFRCGTQEVQVPFGNGWSCVGGSVVRLPFLSTDDHGRAAQHLDYSWISVSPGQTRDFQFIYRDSAGGGSGFNLSDGLRVVFCP
jgi:hypothetical protein